MHPSCAYVPGRVILLDGAEIGRDDDGRGKDCPEGVRGAVFIQRHSLVTPLTGVGATGLAGASHLIDRTITITVAGEERGGEGRGGDPLTFPPKLHTSSISASAHVPGPEYSGLVSATIASTSVKNPPCVCGARCHSRLLT